MNTPWENNRKQLFAPVFQVYIQKYCYLNLENIITYYDLFLCDVLLSDICMEITWLLPCTKFVQE